MIYSTEPEVQRELTNLRDRVACLEPRMNAVEKADKEHAAFTALLAAAVHAEAVMTIVVPRSDMKEYVETLHELRRAIAAAN